MSLWSTSYKQQVTMTPLSSYGKKYTPPKVPVVPAKKYTGDLAFFEQLGDTLVINGALPARCRNSGFHEGNWSDDRSRLRSLRSQ